MTYVDPSRGTKRAFAVGATTLIVALCGLLAFVVLRRRRARSSRPWFVRFVAGAAVGIGLFEGMRRLSPNRTERRPSGIRLLAGAGLSAPVESAILLGGYILAAGVLIALGVWLACTAYY